MPYNNNYGGYGGGYGGNYGGGYGGNYNPYSARGRQNSLIDFPRNNFEYVGRPIQAMGNSMQYFGEMNRGVVDQNSAIDLAINTLEVEPEDERYKTFAREKLKLGVEEISNSDNYHTVYARAKSLATDFQSDAGLKTAVQSSQNFRTWREELRGRYEAGDDVSTERYNHYMDMPFTPTAEDRHGFYNKWIAPSVMKDFKHDKFLQDFARNWKANTTVEGFEPAYLQEEGEDKKFVGWKTTVWETKNEKDLAKAMEYAILANEHASAFAQELSDIRTTPDKEVTQSNIIDDWIKPYAQQASYAKDVGRYQLYNIPVDPQLESNEDGALGYTDSGHGYKGREVMGSNKYGEDYAGLRKSLTVDHNKSIWDDYTDLGTQTMEAFGSAYDAVKQGMQSINIFREDEEGNKETIPTKVEFNADNRKYDISKIHNSKEGDPERAIINIIENTFQVDWEDVVRGSTGDKYSDLRADEYIDFAIKAMENGYNSDKSTRNLVANQYFVFTDDVSDERTRHFLGIKDGVTDIKGINHALQGHKIWSVENSTGITADEFVKEVYDANQLGTTDKNVPTKARVIGQLDYNSTIANQAADDSYLRGYVMMVNNKMYIINENPDNIRTGEIILNRMATSRYMSGVPITIPQLYGANVSMLTDKNGRDKYILRVNDETKAKFDENVTETVNEHNIQHPDDKIESLEEYYKRHPSAKSIAEQGGIVANTPEELLRMILNLGIINEDGTTTPYTYEDFDNPGTIISDILTGK